MSFGQFDTEFVLHFYQDVFAKFFLNGVNMLNFMWAAERNSKTFFTCATGTTDTVGMGFRIFSHIEV